MGTPNDVERYFTYQRKGLRLANGGKVPFIQALYIGPFAWDIICKRRNSRKQLELPTVLTREEPPEFQVVTELFKSVDHKQKIDNFKIIFLFL